LRLADEIGRSGSRRRASSLAAPIQ
jgi:hypothetical protein